MSSDLAVSFGPWQQVALADLVKVHHGFAFRGEHFVDRPTPDVLVTPGNFSIGGGFSTTKFKYYDGPVDPKFVLAPGALIVTMTDLSKAADTLGSPALVPDVDGHRFLHNQRVGRVEILEPAVLDRAFLYWFLRSDGYRRRIVATATGTTVRHTSPTRIGEQILSLPPLEEQRRIAAVLGALDDKMASNQRVGARAEQAAAAACQRIAVVASSAPDGWTLRPFSDAVEINPKIKISRGEHTPFVEMSAVGHFATRPSQLASRDFSGGAKFERFDTLFARITPCTEHGKGAFVDFVDSPAAGSTEFVVFRAKAPLTPEAVFVLSRDERLRAHAIQNMVGTSGRQRVDNACWSTVQVAVAPASPERDAAAQLLRVAMQTSLAAWTETGTLRAIRDDLLPRLVGGKIRVPKAQEMVDLGDEAALSEVAA